MSFFAELKRRNVIRVGLAYVLMGWVLLQGADFAFDLIEAPNWVIQSLAVIVAIGLPIALFFAWAFELTPDGIKRDADVDRSQPTAPGTGRKLDRLIIGILAIVIVAMAVERFMGPEEAQEPVEQSQAQEDAVAEAPSIAVLPFVNMSNVAEQEYFSDGITEEILNRLVKVGGLQVVARTSTFSFKGQNLDIREIAETLDVDHIVEGSVRRDGDQVRITAQLIRAEDGIHLWSETYDRRLESIFAVQDEISGEIAGALQVSLGIIDVPAAAREVDPEAYDLYLQARSLHRKRGPGVVTAIGLFNESLAIEPEFAPAWAGLSHALNVAVVYASREEMAQLGDTISQSVEAAERALELDPNLPTALHAMANALLAQYRLLEAAEYFERAAQADPESTDMMEDYNHFLAYTFQPEAAEAVALRMLALDPLVPIYQFSAATTFHSLGDVEARNQAIETALELSPGLSNLQVTRLKILLENQDWAAAHELADSMDLQGYITPEAVHRTLDWVADPSLPVDDEMREVMRFTPEIPLFADRNDLFVDSIWVNPLPGNWENKFGILAMLNSPIGDGLYSDLLAEPETRQAIRDVGLEDFWRASGWPKRCRPLGDDDFTCG